MTSGMITSAEVRRRCRLETATGTTASLAPLLKLMQQLAADVGVEWNTATTE